VNKDSYNAADLIEENASHMALRRKFSDPVLEVY
jgi:hypothetical protein